MLIGFLVKRANPVIFVETHEIFLPENIDFHQDCQNISIEICCSLLLVKYDLYFQVISLLTCSPPSRSSSTPQCITVKSPEITILLIFYILSFIAALSPSISIFYSTSGLLLFFLSKIITSSTSTYTFNQLRLSWKQ